MKKQFIFLSIALFGVFCSCNKEEDPLMPEKVQVLSRFMPDENDNSPEAELRRAFYQEENSYLLFNDTIYREQVGVDKDGNPLYQTETLDIFYSVGANTMYDNDYRYNYLQTIEEKEQAAEFLKTYIHPLLSENFRPFSWLMVDMIKKIYPWYDPNYYEEQTILSGERCIALSAGKILKMSDEEKKAFAKNLQMDVLVGAMTPKQELNTFFAYCEDLYDTLDFGYNSDENYAYGCGFLNSWINPNTGMTSFWHPDKSQDVKDFIVLALNNTEAEVQSKFSAYPVILEKYEIIKELLAELGY